MNDMDVSNMSSGENVPPGWKSREVRDELDTLLRRDLLGPWDGEAETITGSVGPRDRYITGLLAPLDAAEGEDPGRDDEDLDAGEFGDESDDKPVAGVSALTLFPSSMGVTFTVDAGVDEVLVRASWGRYTKARPEGASVDVADGEDATPALTVNEEDTDRRAKRPWVRTPQQGSVTLDLSEADETHGGRFRDEKRVCPDGAPNVWVRWIVRARSDGRRVVTVFLVNRQTRDEFGKAAGVDAGWMFQSHLEVTAVDGQSAVFVPSDAGGGFVSETEDREQAMLAMMYRHSPEYAAGHGVAVGWNEPEDLDPIGEGRRAWRLFTDSLPTHDVPQTAAPTAADVPGFGDERRPTGFEQIVASFG